MIGRSALAALVLLLAILGGLAAPVARGSAAAPEIDEWDFLNLMNRERRAAGLRPLAMASGAREVARTWSGAMARRGSISHNPEYAAQLIARYPDYLRVGENVGVGTGMAALHEAFMASVGHRTNILGDYGAVGVGVLWTDRLWVTVNFVKAASPPPFLTRTPVSRISGASDPDTAVLVSRRIEAASAAAVVVARVDDFADALSGGPLAVANRGPVLLTPPAAAPANVVAEAKRVLAPSGTVYLLGGGAALSPAVEVAFTAAGMRTTRLAGPDRFATATVVADRVNLLPTEVLLVSGVNFADAVVAGAAAGARRAPILLVGPTNVPPATSAYLTLHPLTRRTLIGGPAAVSAAVAGATGVTQRLSGNDRFGTAVAVAQSYFPSATRVAVASGARYQDALVAAPEAGRDGYPVVLSASPPSTPTYDYVGGQVARWASALVVGRPGDVSDDTVVTLFS